MALHQETTKNLENKKLMLRLNDNKFLTMTEKKDKRIERWYLKIEGRKDNWQMVKKSKLTVNFGKKRVAEVTWNGRLRQRKGVELANKEKWSYFLISKLVTLETLDFSSLDHDLKSYSVWRHCQKVLSQ